jgi:hypothetical protein
MNLKTTLALLLLVAGGAVLYQFGPALPASLGLVTPPPAPAEGGTLAVLAEVTPDKVTRIKVVQGERHLFLERGAGGEWTLPGKWPTRPAEVEQLLGLLTHLESRFVSERAHDYDELKKYGLDRPAVRVMLKAGGKDYRFDLAEKEDDTANRFARETYLRLEDRLEVVRLGPGLIAALDRPIDYYQQRRLFPVERVAREGDPANKVERLKARELAVKENKPEGLGYTLGRDGDDWKLTRPVTDRVDPDKLKTLLVAVPDIWAERFIKPDKPLKEALKDYGLEEAEQTLSVTRDGGAVVELLVGKVSQTKTRTPPAPPPAPFGPPPPPPVPVTEEYRYAKLKDNDQVFEIKANKLKDVFVKLDDLRDARLAHFRTEAATRLEVAQPGQKPIAFVKDKDKNRWKLQEPFEADAEASKVTELLDKLSALSARDKDVIDKLDAKEQGLDSPVTVTVTAEEEVKPAGGAASAGQEPADAKDKKKVTKTFTFLLGKHDAKANKMFVQVKGWQRVNSVDGSLAALVQRPALAYRGRRVLDFDAAGLDGIKIQRPDETLVLKLDGSRWKLTEPVRADADDGKTSQLAASLSNLDVVEFAADAVKKDDLESLYGLGKPALTVTLTFRDDKKPAQTLLIGKQRKDKPDYYARLADGDSVFVVTKEIRDSLDQPSLAFRPLRLWQVPATEIAEIRITKEGQEEYRLARQDKGEGWKVAAPFQADVQPGQVRLMADELSRLRCDRYEAHTVKDPATYGLDKPYLRVTVVPKKEEGKEVKEHTLIIGKATAKEAVSRFARLADSDGVFVVGQPVVMAVDHSALDLLDRRLLALEPDRIKSIRIVKGDAKLGLQRKAKDDWQVTESPAEPFAADKEAVDDLLATWSNLRAQKFAAYDPKAEELAKYGLGKEATTITVLVDRDGKEEKSTLELGKPVEGGAGERYARVNGGPAVAVLPAGTVNTLTQTHLGYVNHTILDIDAGAVEALVRRMGADNLELAKRDDGWHLVKPAEERGDDGTMQNLLRDLTGRAVRVAEYPLKDAKTYGLDEPEAVVTLRLKGDGKKEQVIRIGKPAVKREGEAPAEPSATGDGERYATVNDAKAVLVLPGGLARKLVAGPLGFRNRALASFVDADRAILTRGPRRAIFAKVDGTWKLTEPLAADAEQAELDNLVNAVAELKASELVAEKPDVAALKRYGLDKPEAAWLFQSGDKDVLHLLLGNKDKSGRIHARLDKGDLVFLLDVPLTKQLLAEYRSRSVWSPSLDSAQAEALTYTRGAGTFTLEKGPDGAWKVAGKPDVKVKAEAVTDALAAVAGLKVERYVVDKSAPMKLYGLDPAELAIEVLTPSGKRTLQVGRNPDGEPKKYYARALDKDRTDVFVISEADAARIVRELPAFTETPPKPEK